MAWRGWKKFPYTNFHELNLDYFLNKFSEIFDEWENLYNTMNQWKEDTDTDLETWKNRLIAELDEKEQNLFEELAEWKNQTEFDISVWEDNTLNALNAWKTATTLVFEQIRQSAENSAVLAEQMARGASDNAELAYQYKQDAETAAASVSASAAQIQQNSNNIDSLTTQVNKLENEIYREKTANGEIIAVTDALPLKPHSLTVEIPYQISGISSFTMRFHKRNMLILRNAKTNYGLTYTPQENGTLTIVGSTTGNSRFGAYGNSTYDNDENIYNLPAGKYTFYAQNTANEAFTGTWHIYKGKSVTKIADTSNSVVKFVNSESQNARVNCQYGTGNTLNHNFRLFLGVGDCTVEDWDEPETTPNTLSISFGQTIYGGTVDLINKTVLSKYADDGTELETPVEISIDVNIPTLNAGANTIWTSVIGSTLEMTYMIEKLVEYETQIETLNQAVSDLDTRANNALNNTFCTLAMFEKIGLIGDSYTTGSIYTDESTFAGTYNNLSWGKNIERLFGNTIKFYARGGLSTKTWLNSSYGMSALEADALTSPCNLYWFGLGINDVKFYNDDISYLGNLTDISEHISGTPWATTFYGNVGQIIERTQAATALAGSKIVISSFVGYRPRRQLPGDIALNNALSIIAEYYGIPFINLKDDEFYMSDYYSNNIIHKHPVAMVYSGMAMANARLFGKAVVDNQTYFKDYHMGTPAPEPEPPDPEPTEDNT